MRPSPDTLPLWVPVSPRTSAWRAWGRNAALFALTVASIYFAGGPRLVIGLMGILLAHEMGHYIACRIYRVDATLPFFLPSPLPPGTFGAFIRIRGPIPNRRALFDIGIAGPLAGFVVCLVVLILGLREATVVPRVPTGVGQYLGDPLLFQWLSRPLLGEVPPGMVVELGPLGFAAWFGLLVTALNMIPVGQLDGGHVTYALLREKAVIVSRWGWWVSVALIYFGPNWILWAVLLRVIGRRHPPTLNDDSPLGGGRIAVGVLGYVVFAICFVPEPFLGSWEVLGQAVDEGLEWLLH